MVEFLNETSYYYWFSIARIANVDIILRYIAIIMTCHFILYVYVRKCSHLIEFPSKIANQAYVLSLSFLMFYIADENGSCDLNLEDPELEKAATRIQAAFRGHNTRKQLEGKMAEGQEEIDIDLNDPGKSRKYHYFFIYCSKSWQYLFYFNNNHKDFLRYIFYPYISTIQISHENDNDESVFEI